MKQCLKCWQQNLHLQYFVQLHLEVPMHIIVMDLIGKFKLLPTDINITLLLEICWQSIQLCSMKASEDVHSKFARTHKNLWDKGTEFYNKLLVQVVSILRIKNKQFTILSMRQQAHRTCTQFPKDKYLLTCLFTTSMGWSGTYSL